MKAGSFVYIVEETESFRSGKTTMIERLIPGKIFTVSSEDAIVCYYGPPHQLTRRGKESGLYHIKVALNELRPRRPNLMDPREFH